MTQDYQASINAPATNINLNASHDLSGAGPCFSLETEISPSPTMVSPSTGKSTRASFSAMRAKTTASSTTAWCSNSRGTQLRSCPSVKWSSARNIRSILVARRCSFRSRLQRANMVRRRQCQQPRRRRRVLRHAQQLRLYRHCFARGRALLIEVPLAAYRSRVPPTYATPQSTTAADHPRSSCSLARSRAGRVPTDRPSHRSKNRHPRTHRFDEHFVTHLMAHFLNLRQRLELDHRAPLGVLLLVELRRRFVEPCNASRKGINARTRTLVTGSLPFVADGDRITRLVREEDRIVAVEHLQRHCRKRR